MAVKSGDDVILIDQCGAKRSYAKGNRMTVTLYQVGELTKGTRIQRLQGGKTYKVTYRPVTSPKVIDKHWLTALNCEESVE